MNLLIGWRLRIEAIAFFIQLVFKRRGALGLGD